MPSSISRALSIRLTATTSAQTFSRLAADAVKRDQTRQLVFLSYVGASEASANSYLATNARAERILKETGVPVTVFRCTHIIGSPENPGPTGCRAPRQEQKSRQSSWQRPSASGCHLLGRRGPRHRSRHDV